MKRETPLVQDVQVAATSAKDARLFRNNVGALPDGHGNYITYGLCPGSSDLIGWTPIIVTPEMVGQQVAVFTAVECKIEHGVRRKAQRAFIEAVRKAGGQAGFAETVEQAILILEGNDVERT